MLTDVSGVNIPSLTAGQFATVYNLFSLVIASMLFTALFLLLSRGRVAPRYRNALVVSAMVCGIAASRDAAFALAGKYQDRHLADRVFELAWTHSQVVLLVGGPGWVDLDDGPATRCVSLDDAVDRLELSWRRRPVASAPR